MTMSRLGLPHLSRLAANVQKPAFDPAHLGIGIVHLGLGAFHRAHMAAYTQAVMADDPRWGIAGVSLQRADVPNALNPQDNLYTLCIRDGSGERAEIIGSIRQALWLQRDLEAILGLMAAPTTHIISLTITEKGYCHDPATGHLNRAHPDIAHDLANPGKPRSAIGLIVEALKRRKGCPVTVLCCDNLPHNGRLLEGLVKSYCAALSPDLWLESARTVSFPCTMVDRIVPATTSSDIEANNARIGCVDQAVVLAEPFSQWVIEDHFVGPRPAWEKAGVQFVADVVPFETMKLRMLNGSHSTIAYLGYLAGHETVADTIKAPGFRALIERLMTEDIAPTLTTPGSIDLMGYRDALVQRFANPALKHRTWQIAMDGSQKLPQRLLSTIRDRIKGQHDIGRLTLPVAAWMRYVGGLDEKGAIIDVRDPLAARLNSLVAGAHGESARVVDALLSVREVFGEDLPGHALFRQHLVAWHQRLVAEGAARVVASL